MNKSYKEVLGRSAMALAFLLDNGRNNLKDGDFVDEAIKQIEEKPTPLNFFMTKEYQREMVLVAQELAYLPDGELCKYIQDEINYNNDKEGKRYSEVIGKNNPTVNQLALMILFDNGSENLLNEEQYQEAINVIKGMEYPSTKIQHLSNEFDLEVLQVARDMAGLSQFELYRYIKNELNLNKDKSKEIVITEKRKSEIIKGLLTDFFASRDNTRNAVNDLVDNEILTEDEIFELTELQKDTIEKYLYGEEVEELKEDEALDNPNYDGM